MRKENVNKIKFYFGAIFGKSFIFRLHMAAERMRKAKILFRDILDSVIDPDPAGGLPGSAASQIAAASKGETFGQF